MKIKDLLLISFLILLLAACGGEDPTATPVPPTAVPPTAAPATEAPQPTAEGSYVDSLEHTPDPNLVNIAWQWERRDNADGSNTITISQPDNYQLVFNEDGTFAARLDCNDASGRYATSSPGAIFMELGPTTMAACPEGSQADAMSQMFGPAQDYRFEEDGAVLVFSWAAGGPVDYFRNAATSAATDTGSMVDELEHTPDPNLVNITWAWEQRDPNGNQVPAIDVPNPENYTLFFNEDGTFNAKVDCNQAGGRYATQANGGIFMELGPTTLAACGEDSLDSAMMGIFGGAVQDYRIEEDGAVLVFSWAAGGPVDTYRNVESVDLPEPAAGVPTGTVIAPDGIFLRTGPGTDYPYVGVAPFGDSGEIIGVSQDGQWWLADAPDLPGGQVWVSAAFVEVVNGENVPVVAAPPLSVALTGTPWQWVSTTSGAGVTTVNDPTRYIVLFNDDGTANIQADCNSVLANYTADGSNITITPGASTLAACPADSLGDQFVSQLGSAVIYFIEAGSLYLDLPADSGTMRFVPQGSPPPNPEAPAGEADGNTLYLVSYGPPGAETAVIPGTLVTLSLAGNQATGSAGCNNYSGAVTPINDYFTIDNIITTRMACDENVMAQEQAYLTALANITGYQWEQQLVGNTALITQGQLFYTLPDGTSGVLNFVASP